MVDTGRVLALVDAQARSRRSIIERLGAALLRVFRGLDPQSRYDDAAVDRYARQAAMLSRTAQTAAGGATQQFLRQILAELGTVPAGRRLDLPQQIRSVDPVEVYQRPVRDVRRLVVQGLDEVDAVTRAESRLQLIGETDVSLAVRETTRRVLAAADKVTGYRRVIHPELSQGGTCGLCIVAADRIYRVDNLMPIHDRCRCEALPIVQGKPDPGLALNRGSLTELYRAAGSTSAADLKRVRVQEVQHGELGPVLTNARHDNATSEQVARRATSAGDIRVNPRAVLTSALETISALEARQAAGEDVTGPLAYQRALASRMRSKITSAA